MRIFTWFKTFSVLLFCAAIIVAPAATAATPERPNIIIILADDLGSGDLGINGSAIRTPNIDGLAKSGVQMTDFYASANVCTPSRAGLLTGRYPIRSGLAAGVIEVESTHGLSQSELTLAEYLGAHNYETAIVGKWHLGHNDDFRPRRHGFDYFLGVHYSNDMRPLDLYENEEIVDRSVKQSTLTQRYTQAAVNFIEKNSEQPFFLYFAHTFPHIPLHASENFKGKSAAGIYGDSVEELDWSVGQVIKTLAAEGLLENTLLIFTSDNGAWFEGSNASFRDMKGLTWDGGYRVPMIASWPEKIRAGSASQGISMNIDLFPTIKALLEPDSIDAPDFDGKNIWPLLMGEQASPHDVLYLFNDEDIAAVRTQRWKYLSRVFYKTRYIAFEGIQEAMGFDYQLLFDMTQPQAERYSMASNEPQTLQIMQDHLQEGRRVFEPLRTQPAAEVFP